MKNKHDQGFSLVEILVAIVILTAFVVPTCSALVMTAKMNEKTDDLMKAQLAVSSAVETLMAEGIPTSKLGTGTTISVKDDEKDDEDEEIELYTYLTYTYEDTRFSTLTITVSQVKKEQEDGTYALMPWYDVTVASEIGSVEAKTSIRAVTETVNGGGSNEET